ncbi:recombinase family protein [Pontibacillus yanchengensis]|uniref:Recombinase family protein n=2 Tax=Pontibacillus yanchengensis TaxID=462910 RepID=A0ACC7VLD6_9BACI|nr:recombinase family protein [Pontibacillus yanchengensis]MYL35537.1 recombinase family protein [Pontibacillus yanchengensis]MYL55522.1 recombinase family protein [Pontibacillus yanchengensis]
MRCAVYIRVSTDKEEQKASLKYQKDLFYRYIEEQGWDIYEIYVDVQTGTTAKRKNLQKMIEDAQDKKFDMILAKELSRLARNGELSYKIKNLCENQGIHIITLDNAINTLEGNTNMFGLYAWLYEQESQNTSNRVKETLRTRAKKGLFQGSIPPYGYNVQDGKLQVRDDITPDIVKRIFDEYLSGSGRESIARRLYNEDIPTPADVAGKKNAGDKWNDSTIKLILTNPHYVGDLVQGRSTTVSVTSKKRKTIEKEQHIVHKDTHEPIISREVFNAVQRQLKRRSKMIPAPKKHLFTNILFCADCGKGMWYRSNRKGYICGSYARYGNKACTSHTVKEDLLKNTILTDIKTLVEDINKEEYVKQLELKSKQSKKDIQKQIDKVNKQIDLLKRRKSKYLKLLADEKIAHDDYLENVEANNTEINELVQKKSELLISLESEQVVDNINHLKQELLSFLNFDELTPEMLHRLVHRIEVKENGIPKIQYAFSIPQ